MFEELLADVAADARRAGDIIHGIHHFVRKGEGTWRSVNMNEVMGEVLRLLHSDLLGRGTAIETELAPSLPSVDANPVHLQQVLLNLLMNSLEAMQSIPVAKRRIVISTKCEDTSFIMVSVRDHGSGLPEEDLDKVFIPFLFDKAKWDGNGFDHRAFDCGGSWREIECGKWRRRRAVFLSLADRGKNVRRGGRVSAAKELVCVVDDDQSVRRGLRRLFKSAGYAAETFASAEDYLAREIFEGPICLVLDVRMPGLNGLDLQEALETAGSLRADCFHYRPCRRADLHNRR